MPILGWLLRKTSRTPCFRQRSVAVVVVDDSTENVAAVHRPIALATYFGDWNLLIEALMRARGVEKLLYG